MLKRQERKDNRYKNFDYASKGAYFITICTKDRVCLLSEIVRNATPCAPKSSNNERNVGGAIPCVPQINLSKYGIVVENIISNINKLHNDVVNIERYVIMPNHIHLIIRIFPQNETQGIAPPTISEIIRKLKIFSNKNSGIKLWQRSFYDRIIRNDEEYKDICDYIEANPYNWQTDEYFAEVEDA